MCFTYLELSVYVCVYCAMKFIEKKLVTCNVDSIFRYLITRRKEAEIKILFFVNENCGRNRYNPWGFRTHENVVATKRRDYRRAIFFPVNPRLSWIHRTFATFEFRAYGARNDATHIHTQRYFLYTQVGIYVTRGASRAFSSSTVAVILARVECGDTRGIILLWTRDKKHPSPLASRFLTESPWRRQWQRRRRATAIFESSRPRARHAKFRDLSSTRQTGWTKREREGRRSEKGCRERRSKKGEETSGVRVVRAGGLSAVSVYARMCTCACVRARSVWSTTVVGRGFGAMFLGLCWLD